MVQFFLLITPFFIGLQAVKAHATIKKRLSFLPEDEKSILIAKYEGAETSDVQVQNNILMMLLRAHFESKQAAHSHTALPDGTVKWALLRYLFSFIILCCWKVIVMKSSLSWKKYKLQW